ncbi:MAG: DUF6122 family protein [Cytophagales bacterium]|nr:DUF6122 family protein [Cytophagales bacterium]
MSLQFFIHYFLHLGAPFFLAVIFFKDEWKKAYFIMLATMLVDLDHLMATPVFQANRCSIGYHPLHTIYAAGVYVVLFFLKKPWRIIGIGLLFHLLTDAIDCMFMFGKCGACHEGNPLYELLGS